MEGYKATTVNMTCRGYKFTLHTTFTHQGIIRPCKSGFHFCPTLEDVFNYYTDNDTRIFQVRAVGEVDALDDKCVTNKIKFVREIPIEEIYEQCQHIWQARRIAAYRHYKLDVLINDPYWHVRCEVARQQYGLDVLVNDPNTYVRREVARQQYGLDVLVNDPNTYVREQVAKQGYGLDVLVNDPDWEVRKQVAMQGYGLDILMFDRNLKIRHTAKQKMSTRSRILAHIKRICEFK